MPTGEAMSSVWCPFVRLLSGENNKSFVGQKEGREVSIRSRRRLAARSEISSGDDGSHSIVAINPDGERGGFRDRRHSSGEVWARRWWLSRHVLDLHLFTGRGCPACVGVVRAYGRAKFAFSTDAPHARGWLGCRGSRQTQAITCEKRGFRK